VTTPSTNSRPPIEISPKSSPFDVTFESLSFYVLEATFCFSRSLLQTGPGNRSSPPGAASETDQLRKKHYGLPEIPGKGSQVRGRLLLCPQRNVPIVECAWKLGCTLRGGSKLRAERPADFLQETADQDRPQSPMHTRHLPGLQQAGVRWPGAEVAPPAARVGREGRAAGGQAGFSVWQDGAVGARHPRFLAASVARRA
jgi:hypothetical protein